MNPPSTDPIREAGLTWRAFALFLLGIVGCYVYSVHDQFSKPEDRLTAIGVGLIVLGITGYTAYRWIRLRRDLASGVLSPAEFKADFRKHLYGPPRNQFALIAALVLVAVVWAFISVLLA